jgi:hypothetical protein
MNFTQQAPQQRFRWFIDHFEELYEMDDAFAEQLYWTFYSDFDKKEVETLKEMLDIYLDHCRYLERKHG